MGALARIQSEVGYDKLLYDDQIGKVSLIGAGHALAPRHHRQVLRRARRRRVNIEMISTSRSGSR